MANNFKQFLDASQCAAYRDAIDAAIAESSVAMWRDDLDSDVRIYNAQRKLPVFQPLFDAMVAHHTEQRGEAPGHALLMVNRVLPKDGNLGSGGGWHRDTWFNQNKVFVFFTDVDEANGPFEYVPGSGTLSAKLWDLVRHGRSLRIPDERVAKRPKRLLTIKEGQGTYFDTTLVHRGSPIREGGRYAATLYAFNTKGEKLRKSRERFDAL